MNPWFQLLAHVQIFTIMAICSDSDHDFLILCIIYTYKWLEGMEKWPCGNCFAFYYAMLRNDVLIENKYSIVIMQSIGAMK